MVEVENRLAHVRRRAGGQPAAVPSPTTDIQMNYYDHHIGDYDADTSHLSWMEDMAYTRLLRLYYRREKPITPDLVQACRLVRARSGQQKAAVAQVLREFFVLQSDGWHQSRCDQELQRYQEGAPERDARRENEKERQRRTRERRRQLFEQLRQHGVVPAYDAPMAELQALLTNMVGRQMSSTAPSLPEAATGSVVTRDTVLPVTTDPGDATASQPQPQPHTHTHSHTPSESRLKEPVPAGTAWSKGGRALAKAADMPRDELWRIGKSLLADAGMPAAQCGSYVGRMIKEFGEPVARDAIAAALVKRPADPAQYLMALCRRAVGLRAPLQPRDDVAERRAATLAGLTGRERLKQDPAQSVQTIDVSSVLIN